MQTYRGPPAEWTAPPTSYSPAPDYGGSTPSTFQLVLENAELSYDEVDNPIEIHDWRNASDWPSGAKPVTRKAQYDDLYRLTKIDYQYSTGDDTWVDPFESEDSGQNTDTRRAKPSPHVSFDKRVLSQSYQYDWLGNITQSTDDAAGFYDRSLGTQTHSATKPYQLTGATGATSTRDGSLGIAYDDAGNMTSMALLRNGSCVPSTATCSQRFVYDWDEVGRLARARRWDLASPGVASDPVPATTPDVELRYAYDGSDQRVIKTAVDAQQNESHTVYVFAALELRRAAFEGGDYDDTRDTEVAYLFAHGVRLARLHYAEGSLPTLTSGHLHVLLELPDHLGSSAIVVDRETSELVEQSTYQAYGGAESDYRPARWDGFRADYRFTGKEEDAEVGLAYFGKRFLAVGLCQWLSPDPLAVHVAGAADSNLFAYVHGRLLSAVDVSGLNDLDGGAPAPEGGNTEVAGARDQSIAGSNNTITIAEVTIYGEGTRAAVHNAPTGTNLLGSAAAATMSENPATSVGSVYTNALLGQALTLTGLPQVARNADIAVTAFKVSPAAAFDKAVGAVNAFNPLYHFGIAVAEGSSAVESASNGDALGATIHSANAVGENVEAGKTIIRAVLGATSGGGSGGGGRGVPPDPVVTARAPTLAGGWRSPTRLHGNVRQRRLSRQAGGRPEARR